jgi:hypothetical protein
MSLSFSIVGSSCLRFQERISSLKVSENTFISSIAKIVLTEFGMRLAALAIAGSLVYFALKNKFRAGELIKTLELDIDQKLANMEESSRLSSRANHQAVVAFAVIACVEGAIFIFKR